MVDVLQAQLAQFKRAAAKAEADAEKGEKAQKAAESNAALAREERTKLRTQVATHTTGAEDSQRKLKELGDVRSYYSLAALAKGGNPAAQQLLALQARLLTEDPASFLGRSDAQRISALQKTLGDAGLQPQPGVIAHA